MADKKISNESHAEALKIARGTQRPGQTKEQTKLIVQGIETGIAAFKKQQKTKARERDRYRKKELKTKTQSAEEPPEEKTKPTWLTLLPWYLLTASWLLFVVLEITRE